MADLYHYADQNMIRGGIHTFPHLPLDFSNHDRKA